MERKLLAFSCIAFLILIDVSVHARELEDKIVFVSERRGTPEVFLVEGLDGRPFQLTRDLFASWPSISPDGTEVVFVSNPPAQTANILKLNIAKRQIERLTHNAEQEIRYEHLDWSPDGREILFIMVTDTLEGSKMDLCVMDTEGRQIRHILQLDPPTWISNPSWAPDSNHIIYRQDIRIFIIDDNGNNIVNVPQDQFKQGFFPFKQGFLPAWSPKRNQIGYIEIVTTSQPPPNPLQIYMMNLAKASVTPLTSGGDEERIPLAWHPDGQRILFVMLTPVTQGTRWSDIFVMDNNGENIINLTQTPEIEAHASWSPDGKQIVFDRSTGEDDSAIFVMEADRLCLTDRCAPSWSPDGNRIAFLSYRNGALRIYTMDTNGQNVQQVTQHGREFDGPPVWSPNGRWIAFMSGDDQDDWGLYVTDPQGHHENLITRFKLTYFFGLPWYRPAWSPDSQYLIYAVEQKKSPGLVSYPTLKGEACCLVPWDLLGCALPSLSGASGVLVTTAPPRKATAAFLMFIAALWSLSKIRPQSVQSWTLTEALS